jgi:hypothetical protein
MDQPESEQNSHRTNSSDDPGIGFPGGFHLQQKNTETTSHPKDDPNKKQDDPAKRDWLNFHGFMDVRQRGLSGWFQSELRKFWRETPVDRKIELLIAFAILFFSGTQVYITWSNSKSSTEQIERMITAADRIDDAADSFSGSAAHINLGISQAVEKLNSQAQATSDVAKAAGQQAHAAGIVAGNAAAQSKAAADLATNSTKQLDTMQRQLEETDRPWIKVTDLEFIQEGGLGATWSPPVQNYKYRLSIPYKVKMSNLGKSPALNIAVWSEVYFSKLYPGMWADVKPEEERYCKEAERAVPQDKERGTAIFPGDPGVEGQLGSADVSDENTSPKVGNIGPSVSVFLIGCVNYTFQTSPNLHQTRFVFQIMHKDEPKYAFVLGTNYKSGDLLSARESWYDYVY